MELTTRRLSISHVLLVLAVRKCYVAGAYTHVTRYKRALTMTQWPWSIKDTRKRGGFYGNLGAIRIFAFKIDDDVDDHNQNVFQTNLRRNICEKTCAAERREICSRTIHLSSFSLHAGREGKKIKPRSSARQNLRTRSLSSLQLDYRPKAL